MKKGRFGVKNTGAEIVVSPSDSVSITTETEGTITGVDLVVDGVNLHLLSPRPISPVSPLMKPQQEINNKPKKILFVYPALKGGLQKDFKL